MFETKSTNRLGNDGFIWFYGVVEDIDDPLQLGRVRVRILGDHTQSNKEERIPTDCLPWAYAINDIHSSSMQGIGTSPTGLYVCGSWIFGFYSDGIDKQQPIILGSFGGIPESIPWKSENVGFQDPNMEFPMGHHIFEQDTNRLARTSNEDHTIEIPEDLVPPQEAMIQNGLCPKKPVFGKKYYDTFDEAYVRKFGQGEESKHGCNDVVSGMADCNTVQLDVQSKEDTKCQYFLNNNTHPFTVYKFINRERFIPKAKVFADPMHREYWHEADNPWNAQYPYNKVWEGFHKVGTSATNNNSEFVSESFAYDQSITNYDGSEKEGIHRKQICGLGSWGLGEEWDSTEGNQRYHRFHPSANYFEIDNAGNETRKIYGDSFEIDLKDKTILIKGDWNVTVEGNKNQLIEGNYNLQVMGNKNTDVRGDINTYADGNNEWHFKENSRLRVDGDERIRIGGSRSASVLVDDYVESQNAERRADKIVRKGASSIIDEAFMEFELIAHDAKYSVCNIENVFKSVNITIDELTEDILTYRGCIKDWEVRSDEFYIYYEDEFDVERDDWTCGVEHQIEETLENALENTSASCYTETDGMSKCLKKYHEAIEAAKDACSTTLTDPRTLKDYTRFDYEKYHASIDSCKRSYEACIKQNANKTCEICEPQKASIKWVCEPCHDPNCKTGDKEYEFYNCNCECHSASEEIIKDPWSDCAGANEV